MEPPTLHSNMHAFKALQRQLFHRAKRKLHQALTAVITRLQFRDGFQDGIHFLMSQSPAQIWEHGPPLKWLLYQVWVCYRVASHQLNLYFPGRVKGTRYARGIWSASENTKVFFISFGTASVRRRCGYTSSRSGHDQKYSRANSLVQASSIVEVGT